MITPDGNERCDLSVGTRQSWDDILVTFADAGLLGAYSKGKNEYRIDIRTKMWDKMRVYMLEKLNLKLEYTPYKRRRGRKCYYAVVYENEEGIRPNYTNPIAQERKTDMTKLRSQHVSRDRSRADANLASSLKKHRVAVHSDNLLHRMKDADDAQWKAAIDAARSMGVIQSELLGSNDETDEDAEDSDDVRSEAIAAYDDIQTQIDAALNLDFDVRLAGSDLRPSRKEEEGIEIHSRKQADDKMRSCAIFLSELWGYSDTTVSWEGRQRIANAVCRLIAYDHGYAKSTGGSQLWKWRKQATAGILGGKSHPIGRRNNPRTAYTDTIEKDNPGYLHELCRYALRTKGIRATFDELATSMNAKSAVESESRPTLSLHKLQVYRWFRKNGGKEISAKEKPLLTKQHKKDRLKWIQEWAALYLTLQHLSVTLTRSGSIPLRVVAKLSCYHQAPAKMKVV